MPIERINSKESLRELNRKSLVFDLINMFIEGKIDEELFLGQAEYFANAEELEVIKQWELTNWKKIIYPLVGMFIKGTIRDELFYNWLEVFGNESEVYTIKQWVDERKAKKAS